MFPRLPPSYRGSRLLVCLMLSIGVAAFFSTYGHVVGTPSLSYQRDLPDTSIVPQSLVTLAEYDPFDDPRPPDMNSAAVKLASADVLQSQSAAAAQPRKAQIKTAVEAKPEQRRRSVKRQKAKPTQIAKAKARSQGKMASSHR